MKIGPHPALHFLVLHQVRLQDLVRAAGNGAIRCRPVLAAHSDVVVDRAFRVRVPTRLEMGMEMGMRGGGGGNSLLPASRPLMT